MDSKDIYSIYSKLVVNIEAKNFVSGKTTNGCGVIIKQHSVIFTNYHIIEGCTKYRIFINNTEIKNVETKYFDANDDLLIISIDPETIANLPEINISETVDIGDNIFCVSNPFGKYNNTLTSGIVSNKSRNDFTQDFLKEYSDFKYSSYEKLHITNSISPGSSGGAVIDIDGNLVGIIQGADKSLNAQSINFAIPIQNYLSTNYNKIKLFKSDLKIMGISYFNSDKYEDAIIYLKAYNKHNKSDPESYYVLSLSYYYQKKYKLALRDINKALKIDSSENYYHYWKAEILFTLKCFEAALSVIDKLIIENKYNSEIYNFRGYLFLRKKDNLKALKNFNKSIDIDGSAYCYNNRGLLYYYENLYELAEKDLLKSIELNDSFDKSLNNLGLVYLKQNKYNEALNYINKALNLNSEDKNILNNIGLALTELTKYDEALTHLNKAIELDPNLPSAYNNRGYLYFMIDNKEKAESDLKKSISLYRKNNYDLAPDIDITYKSLGIIYLEKKKYSLALKNIDKAIMINNKLNEVYYFKSEILNIQKKYNEALLYIDKCIKLEKDNQNYMYYELKAKILFNLDSMQDALKSLNKAIELTKDEDYLFFLRGKIFYKLKKYEKAIQDFNKAIFFDINNSEAYFYRGLCCIKLGLNARAILDLETYTILDFKNSKRAKIYIWKISEGNLNIELEEIKTLD